MQEISNLKMNIKFFFYIFFSSIFLYVIKGLFAFMEEDLTYIGECEDSASIALIFIIFFIKLISRIIFFVGGFYLIKILNFNELKEVFSTEKIHLFKKSGKLFLYST